MMFYLLHLLFVLNIFCAALAGAIHLKFTRKIPYLSFVYFGWSLVGQIFAFPLAILAIISLYVATGGADILSIIVIIDVIALSLFCLTLWQAWKGSQALAKIASNGNRASISRYLLGAIFPFRLAKRNVERVKNISYGPFGKRNTLDIYSAKNKPNALMPVLIHVHGGGWVVGHKKQQAQPLIQHMASNGWLVVDINYRLAPRNKMPVMIQDVLRSVAWVKDHIETYNGDPNFVAMTGGSAGGHLVALAALASDVKAFKTGFETTDCRLNACVPIYGVYDFLNQSGAMRAGAEELKAFMTKLVMPGPPETHLDVWEQAAPLNHIHANAPPMLFFHGRHDALADFESAKFFAKLLQESSSNKVIFAELPSGQHAYDIAQAPPTPEHVRVIHRFLENVRLDQA